MTDEQNKLVTELNTLRLPYTPTLRPPGVFGSLSTAQVAARKVWLADLRKLEAKLTTSDKWLADRMVFEMGLALWRVDSVQSVMLFRQVTANGNLQEEYIFNALVYQTAYAALKDRPELVALLESIEPLATTAPRRLMLATALFATPQRSLAVKYAQLVAASPTQLSYAGSRLIVAELVRQQLYDEAIVMVQRLLEQGQASDSGPHMLLIDIYLRQGNVAAFNKAVADAEGALPARGLMWLYAWIAKEGPQRGRPGLQMEYWSKILAANPVEAQSTVATVGEQYATKMLEEHKWEEVIRVRELLFNLASRAPNARLNDALTVWRIKAQIHEDVSTAATAVLTFYVAHSDTLGNQNLLSIALEAESQNMLHLAAQCYTLLSESPRQDNAALSGKYHLYQMNLARNPAVAKPDLVRLTAEAEAAKNVQVATLSLAALYVASKEKSDAQAILERIAKLGATASTGALSSILNSVGKKPEDMPVRRILTSLWEQRADMETKNRKELSGAALLSYEAGVAKQLIDATLYDRVLVRLAKIEPVLRDPKLQGDSTNQLFAQLATSYWLGNVGKEAGKTGKETGKTGKDAASKDAASKDAASKAKAVDLWDAVIGGNSGTPERRMQLALWAVLKVGMVNGYQDRVYVWLQKMSNMVPQGSRDATQTAICLAAAHYGHKERGKASEQLQGVLKVTEGERESWHTSMRSQALVLQKAVKGVTLTEIERKSLWASCRLLAGLELNDTKKDTKRKGH